MQAAIPKQRIGIAPYYYAVSVEMGSNLPTQQYCSSWKHCRLINSDVAKQRTDISTAPIAAVRLLSEPAGRLSQHACQRPLTSQRAA